MTVLALITFLAIGWALRERRTSSRLRARRSRTARALWDLRRDRREAREDFCSAIETAVEAQRELDRLNVRGRRVNERLN